MFKKPAPPGKENAAATRPRLGLSSLQHTAKMKVESEIESAGASLKVLSVENTRQKVTSSTTAVQHKGSIQSFQPTARSTLKPTPASGATKTNGPRMDTQNGVLRKNADNGGVVSNGQKVVNVEKVKVTNEAKPKPQSNVEHEQKAGASNENANAKSADGTATQQNGEKSTNARKTWELTNFDIGRPLGRGES